MVNEQFVRAAELIVTTIEEDFGLASRAGHEKTVTAIVNIMNHYSFAKTPEQVAECKCFACKGRNN